MENEQILSSDGSGVVTVRDFIGYILTGRSELLDHELYILYDQAMFVRGNVTGLRLIEDRLVLMNTGADYLKA